MKKLILFTLLLFVLVCFFACTHIVKRVSKSTNESDYSTMLQEVEKAEVYMPQLEQLGNYNSVFIATRMEGMTDYEYTITLCVKYEEQDYENECKNVDERYVFLTDTREAQGLGIKDEDLFGEVNGFKFYIVKSSISGSVTNHGMLVGKNDLEKKLAYLFYYDETLYNINDIGKFTKDNFVLP